MSQAGVFEGVVVIELGQYASVPYCAELLAHGGARVVKIEPIGGDATRLNSPIVPGEGRQYVNKSRGKESLALNLGSPNGVEIARRLCARADVVLCNMRPGTAERLGLDYESLHNEHPRLIYGEVTALGRLGPDGGKGGIDPIAQAASGLSVSARSVEEGHTVVNDALLTDFMSGTLLAFGIASALYQRAESGFGQKVETSLLQAALALQHQAASIIEAVDPWKREFVDWIASEKPPFEEIYRRRRIMVGLQHWWLNTYETADGMVTFGAPGRLQARAAKILGLPPELGVRRTVVDPTGEAVKEDYAAAATKVRAWLTADLLAAFEAEGIPCTRVRVLEEVLLGEQAEANRFLQTFDHPRIGPMTLPAPPVRFSEGRYRAAEDTPAYGEHSVAILSELGFAPDEIDQLLAEGAVAGGFEAPAE